MKKAQIILIFLFSASINLTAQSWEFSGNLNFSSDGFTKGIGSNVGYNFKLINKVEIQPTIGFNYLRYQVERYPGSVWIHTGMIFNFGIGIGYPLISKENYKITVGPEIDAIYYPRITSLFSDVTIISEEFRFYGGLNAAFKYSLNQKVGFKTFVEYGYSSASRLKPGVDYRESYFGRTFNGFMISKIGVGLFYNVN